MKVPLRLFPVFCCLGFALPSNADDAGLKQHSAFHTTERISQIRSNLLSMENGADLKKQALEDADYWLKLPDDEIWSLMFGPTIRRSWMVWSNGRCPACTNSVVMYEWIVKPKEHPWKMRCPKCKQLFPKNDFASFYRSGLDQKGVFNPQLADRKLLFNQEHPGENDPLRMFGVDDGEGFIQGEKRWRFIGAYLVYGQFKRLVRDGIQALATGWVLTGETNCARKAGILLDRVADVYPDFDYATQAFVYENQGPAGYVSVWHDACEETREMVIAYDQVFEAIRQDPLLVQFLSEKARKHGLANDKSNFGQIQRNIEDRILRDALKSTAKMHSNFPRQEIAYTHIQAVLGWPENRAEVERYMDAYITRATAVDGVTGEKGLSGYASYTIIGLADLVAEFSRSEPDFLKKMIDRVPTLRQTWKFHVDTMCLDRFYPNSGDCGSFAKPTPNYVGAGFAKLKGPRLSPSMFTFFWQLHEVTGDPAYAQILYRENGDSVAGLPHDLCAPNPERIRRGTEKVIAAEGSRPRLDSIHKSAWHIGILRSGKGAHARALWLDYDAGGAHGHLDGLNVGLFALGQDLLPDFGYPPVQHGGWSTPQVAWYLSPAAHNTVTVDGQAQRPGTGQCTLWADGEAFHLMRASAPALIDIHEFERTAILVDVSLEDFYVIDLFRVRSGSDHTRFVHGPRAEFSSTGLTLGPASPYGRGAMMRNFQNDTNPPPGWRAEWHLSRNRNLRHTDWTPGAIACTAESNVMPYNYDPPEGFWIPSLLIKRTGTAPLASCFVSTLEAYPDTAPIVSALRLPVRHQGQECRNECVAMKLVLKDGGTDYFIATGTADRGMPIELEWDGSPVVFTGDTCLLRIGRNSKAERLALVRSTALQAGKRHVECDPKADLIEINFTPGNPAIVRGEPAQVKSLNFE